MFIFIEVGFLPYFTGETLIIKSLGTLNDVYKETNFSSTIKSYKIYFNKNVNFQQKYLQFVWLFQ